MFDKKQPEPASQSQSMSDVTANNSVIQQGQAGRDLSRIEPPHV